MTFFKEKEKDSVDFFHLLAEFKAQMNTEADREAHTDIHSQLIVPFLHPFLNAHFQYIYVITYIYRLRDFYSLYRRPKSLKSQKCAWLTYSDY